MEVGDAPLHSHPPAPTPAVEPKAVR